MAHISDGNIDLIVPGPSATVLEPGMTDAEIIAYAETVTVKPNSLLTPFEQYAASVLTELQKALRRLRSQDLFTDVVEDSPDADHMALDGDFTQKVRVIGEVWGYGEFHVKNTSSSALVVPSSGDFDTEIVAQVADPRLWPISLARLVSVRGGVMAVGHILSDGSVRLDAISTGADIQPGDTISLAGMWPLANPFDSED